ncbi:LysR family transcriptional regulator [Anaerobacillus sp. HL2]|nr:LysR family transcriptional regulator [Anaerobacillus sp. HL2]
MNLKRIKTFMMSTLDYKSFSAVATILNISQPAVSKQIKTLEIELGNTLLDRETLAAPTEAGRLVYQKGKKILYDWKLWSKNVVDYKGSNGSYQELGQVRCLELILYRNY